MAINPISLDGFPRTGRPWNNITPFTYRDGLTYLEVLEALRAWLKDTLIPHINNEMEEIGEGWNNEVIALIAGVDAALAAQADDVNSALATQLDAINDRADEWLSGEISNNDTITTALVNESGRSTRAAVEQRARAVVDSASATALAVSGTLSREAVKAAVAADVSSEPIRSAISTAIADDLSTVSLLITALDEAIASRVSSPGTDTKAALESAIQDVAADIIANDTTVSDAAVAAMSDAAVIAQLSWIRGTIGVADYDTLTERGIYQQPNGGSAGNMPNKPPFYGSGFPLTVTVTPISSTAIIQEVRAISTTGKIYSFSRQYLNGVWWAWNDDTNTGPLETVDLTTGADLDSLTVGHYKANTSAIANSILNRPLGISGNPFEVVVRPVSTYNNITVQELTHGEVGGTFRRWIRTSLAGVWGAWQRVIDPSFDRSRLDGYVGDIRFYGDSLVQGSGTTSIPGALATVINESVKNFGRGGDTANEVLIRMGVLSVYGKPIGGIIPASGSVDIEVSGTKFDLRDNRAFTVTYQGIPGTLLHVSGNQWRFTRSTAGTEKAVTSHSLFWYIDTPQKSNVYVIIMGENDLWNDDKVSPDSDVVSHVIATYQRAVDAIPSDGEKRVLIAGIKTARSTTENDAKHIMVNTVNAALKTLYPAYYVDRQGWLSSDSLAKAGIAATPADNAAMQVGLIPPSAFSDDLHIADAVMSAEAEHLWAKALTARGWASYK